MKTTNVTLACYGAVIRTWASLGQPEKAQLILEEMIGNSERLPLDLIHFNAIFEAWANKFTSHRDLKGDEIIISDVDKKQNPTIKMWEHNVFVRLVMIEWNEPPII